MSYMNQITQSELANLIRKGYEKHNFTHTTKAYYIPNEAACPIFAAFSSFYESADLAWEDLLILIRTDGWYSFTKSMAKKINAPDELVFTVSKLHDHTSAVVEDTLLLLDLEAFPID